MLPEEITKAQDALVACYKKNAERSLDCWAEVQEFKDLVQKAQNVSRILLVFSNGVGNDAETDQLTFVYRNISLFF